MVPVTSSQLSVCTGRSSAQGVTWHPGKGELGEITHPDQLCLGGLFFHVGIAQAKGQVQPLANTPDIVGKQRPFSDVVLDIRQGGCINRIRAENGLQEIDMYNAGQVGLGVKPTDDRGPIVALVIEPQFLGKTVGALILDRRGRE